MGDGQGTAGRAAARLVYADRRQVLLRPCDLESLLPEDHPARVVWGVAPRLDPTAFHARVGSREGTGGRPAFDPAVLLTLWIYATLEAVGSARALARRCEEHDAYRERPGASECVDAIARSRGLQQFAVRGVPKCLGVVPLFALAHNVLRAVAPLG